MRARHPTKHFKKLLMVNKARILSWRKEGVLVASITDRLGRYRSSIKRLLAKARDFLASSIPERKKGSGRPCVINSYALKMLDRFVEKNPTATTGEIKAQVLEVAAVSVKHISRLVKEILKFCQR
jgi:hypothetical protein